LSWSVALALHFFLGHVLALMCLSERAAGKPKTPTFNIPLVGFLAFLGVLVLNHEREAELISFGAWHTPRRPSFHSPRRTYSAVQSASRTSAEDLQRPRWHTGSPETAWREDNHAARDIPMSLRRNTSLQVRVSCNRPILGCPLLVFGTSRGKWPCVPLQLRRKLPSLQTSSPPVLHSLPNHCGELLPIWSQG
jgi:hypothetical protein